ncbi:hypothetical protein [Nocardia africana]|uniref:hypothetical protein n=1 Tax=Nocardia africana TaxID=134964 RepID=UPI000FE21AC9|nr:hypothetical protein [Nocardia africana]MCC3314753.1 hypothetical protein [Nocardia africana]
MGRTTNRYDRHLAELRMLRARARSHVFNPAPALEIRRAQRARSMLREVSKLLDASRQPARTHIGYRKLRAQALELHRELLAYAKLGAPEHVPPARTADGRRIVALMASGPGSPGRIVPPKGRQKRKPSYPEVQDGLSVRTVSGGLPTLGHR